MVLLPLTWVSHLVHQVSVELGVLDKVGPEIRTLLKAEFALHRISFAFMTRRSKIPDSFMGSDIKIQPLLLATLPKETNSRLIPDIPNQSFKSIVVFEIIHQG
jgi:hypothetical protein